MLYKRVRTLLRVSSKQQLHDDDIPIQRAELADFISKHSDWEFTGEYIEKAVSAYKNDLDQRERLLEILEAAKNKEFDILLTYMSDRIGRKDEYSAYITMLNSYGIEVWTVKDGQLRTDEPIEKLMNFIRFWQNECESRKTGLRVKDALQELVKAGRFVGGKAPFGYQLVDSGQISNKGRNLKKLQIVEEQAEIVRKIFNYAVYKGMGYERIAKALNSEGIHAPVKLEWNHSTIQSILKNPVYMGYIAYNRRVHHNTFIRQDRTDWIYSEKQNPDITIIDPALWEKAQEIRESRKNRIDKSKKENENAWEEKYNYPFSTKGKLALNGLVYCGYCGRQLTNGSYVNKWTIKSTGEERMSFAGRYYCQEKHSERRSYSQKYLEGIVFEVVEKYMETLKKVNITDELEKIHEQELKNCEREVQKIKKQKQLAQKNIETLEYNIPEAIRGEGYFNVETLSKLIEENKNKVLQCEELEQELRKKIENSKLKRQELKTFIQYVPNWKEVFQQADAQTKRIILSSVIDKIIVKDDDIKIRFKIRLEDFIPKSSDSPTILYILGLV